MLCPAERRALRHQFTFESPDDGARFAAVVARRSHPGLAVTVCLGPQRRLLDLLPVERGADDPLGVLRTTARAGPARTDAVLLLTDRSVDLVPEHPDDEVLWDELVDQADALGFELLDWFVLCGDVAFSVADRAPTPARW